MASMDGKCCSIEFNFPADSLCWYVEKKRSCSVLYMAKSKCRCIYYDNKHLLWLKGHVKSSVMCNVWEKFPGRMKEEWKLLHGKAHLDLCFLFVLSSYLWILICIFTFQFAASIIDCQSKLDGSCRLIFPSHQNLGSIFFKFFISFHPNWLKTESIDLLVFIWMSGILGLHVSHTWCFIFWSISHHYFFT